MYDVGQPKNCQDNISHIMLVLKKFIYVLNYHLLHT